MHIPSIYLMFAAELIVLLLAGCLFLAYLLFKRRSATAANGDEDEGLPQGISYVEYLEKELQRNQAMTEQQKKAAPEPSAEEPGDSGEPATENSSERLLEAREYFLGVEKNAAQHGEDEKAFWDTIYKGMQQLLEKYREVITEKVVVEEPHVAHKPKEKVYYIETQGRKIDGEVNKLKDIIYEQENSLNGLRKTLKSSTRELNQESEELKDLHAEIDNFERQLKDSRVCMEVLEMENQRLQEEVDRLKQHPAGDESKTADTSSTDHVEQMREVLDKQDKQISELEKTIDDMELEVEQAQKLKLTIESFTRTSQEMMGCIAILEDENDHLKEALQAAEGGEGGDAAELQEKVKTLEEEVIKKDVEYAKLQDEYSAIEKEYLAMYEAMHGDK